ncbi:hypothetical protein Syun_001499 [Stephania yunnanensis]|uniref:Uncharacterized protein n=1 Tax=Stephania yunnanensis TaxID=152371 RepID=A0AAP0DW59_9MAGN
MQAWQETPMKRMTLQVSDMDGGPKPTGRGEKDTPGAHNARVRHTCHYHS